MIDDKMSVFCCAYPADDRSIRVPFTPADISQFANGKGEDVSSFLKIVGEGNSFFYEVEGENVIEGVDNDCYVKIKLERWIVVRLQDGTIGAAKIGESGHDANYTKNGAELRFSRGRNVVMNALYDDKIKINNPDRCHHCGDWYFPKHEKQNVCKACGDYLVTP